MPDTLTRCELGYAIWCLQNRLWDSPKTSPPTLSRKQLKEVRRMYLAGPTVTVTTPWEPAPAEPAPPRFEDETAPVHPYP